MTKRIASAFGEDASRYDRARPSYPAELVEAIVAASPGRAFVDVGTGTGIAARQFQAHGCTVLGVEVDARMAAIAQQTRVPVEVAAFEQWDVAQRTFDAVVSGQTWHWIDPDAGAAKAAEALRRGGVLALFWNVFALAGDLADAFSAVYRRVLPDLPFEPWARPAVQMYTGILEKTRAGIDGTGAFATVDERRFHWEQVYTRDAWLDQVPTHGGINRFPPERVQALLAGLGQEIDAVGGAFAMPYTSLLLTARRT
ncbi:class I SAM-dependent methyltransferase [Solirubrobacter soli]|uniref:class I SAM-dependent methyltransferase n=1 Tax=Solirubrobacter soli TaxID=363832 RepID=UPI000424E939|nr:class I SAM-dependent methyltransferase [Solirubrobacter soli]